MELTHNSSLLKRIWNQKIIPVIFRSLSERKVRIRVPFNSDNREWIKEGHRNKPKWDINQKCWILPNSWFNDIVNKCIDKYSKVYIIQPFRKQEKCAPACWNAKYHECNCSCMGANHGNRSPNNDWLIISETFATKWGEKEYACRLLSTKK